MVTCVKACADKFGNRVSTRHEALAVFNAIPESLLEREELGDPVQKAGSMITLYLGIVEDLFTAGGAHGNGMARYIPFGR